MLAAVVLSACENTPDNIRSNKHSAEVDSGEAYVSSENIYDSFDAAFEKEYAKFKLPEKSAVSICKPDGVYDFELAYINAKNDMDKLEVINTGCRQKWKSCKVPWISRSTVRSKL